ncbi:hypothetical protein ACFULT_26360 [Rhodococcus sp. NPDC057297]|uniref:hypothetical protein n=1 Tax=Rhodococcus sp. NPDC057297 TaxID=3346090 RepID=UPI0036370386
MTDTSTSEEQTTDTAVDGFPPNTPVADMDPEQQVAYWKTHARRHEDTVKSLKGGLTATEAQELRDKLSAFEQEKLTEQEKAVNKATEEAKAAARAEAEADLLPKLREMQVRSYAASVLSKDQLAAWLPTTNLAYFVGDTGDVDEEKVMGALTAMFGAPDTQRQRDWGQYRTGDRKEVPGESGRAEAERRFGTK